MKLYWLFGFRAVKVLVFVTLFLSSFFLFNNCLLLAMYGNGLVGSRELAYYVICLICFAACL